MKYQIAINIALFCGLRNGEILGLTWNDIDFENKTISINKARAITDDDGMITKYPKTKSSIRTISAQDIVINSLKEYMKIQDKDREILSDLWDPGWYDTPWILTQWDGKGMHYHTISKWLKKIVVMYNESIINDESIPSKEKSVYLLPVLSINKLCYTSATLLISRNTDIKQLLQDLVMLIQVQQCIYTFMD
ncbi:site-specific integrase [Gudongella oleilytica]|uniref:site-specific integrase n=1 Tax=Gudongella oleilytica TaxID=1582259 RepID=UPI002A361D61|nr:site-specific integrase [Gudongella oleilytica]MDY0256017.1 site-specific integrase [Gudongella oleilytica]